MLFNNLGRNNPTENCRVFSQVPKTFYKIDPFKTNYKIQHQLAKKYDLIDDKYSESNLENNLIELNNFILNDNQFSNLFKGIAIPFCLSKSFTNDDLGTQLEDFWLPMLKKEYEKKVPTAYFKATLQGNTELKNSVKLAKNSGYDVFLKSCSNSTTVGYYFPTAFQEFDIKSQRSRIGDLPTPSGFNICLSGPFEIIYSLISYPKLLYSEQNYSPILCASAFEHVDPRMVMLFKSYGPHLEFWLMTQMLTPTKTQVSEQWSGGLTVFKTV